MKYEKPGTRTRAQQEFDRKKIFIMQKGNKINVYDMIQEGREDTEILPTLQKYGNLKPLEIDYERVQNTFSEMMNLRDLYDIKHKADEVWNEIPAKIKQEFNNSQEEFIKKAPKWLETKIQTIQPTTPTTTKETVDKDK